MGRARLAPGPLGVGLGIAPGERGGLPFGRPPQRLHRTAQPRVDLLEPFTLGRQALPFGRQALDPLAQLLPLALQLLLPVPQRGVLLLQQRDPLAPPIRGRARRPVTHARPLGHHRHEGRRLQPTHQASTRYLNTVQVAVAGDQVVGVGGERHQPAVGAHGRAGAVVVALRARAGEADPLGQMTYNLRRLRLAGLIRRLPHNNRYTPHRHVEDYATRSPSSGRVKPGTRIQKPATRDRLGRPLERRSDVKRGGVLVRGATASRVAFTLGRG
jgi:hypothetical protein